MSHIDVSAKFNHNEPKWQPLSCSDSQFLPVSHNGLQYATKSYNELQFNKTLMKKRGQERMDKREIFISKKDTVFGIDKFFCVK